VPAKVPKLNKLKKLELSDPINLVL